MGALRRQAVQNIYMSQPCRRRILSVWMGILLWVIFPGGLFLEPGLAADSLPASVTCPLTHHNYKAYPIDNHLEGVTGEAMVLSFDLEPSQLPQGFFMSVNLREVATPEIPEKKEKPEILTGFPDTRLVFHAPGIYRYAVVVSMIAKSSCGGVKADTVFNGEIRITVSQPK